MSAKRQKFTLRAQQHHWQSYLRTFTLRQLFSVKPVFDSLHYVCCCVFSKRCQSIQHDITNVIYTHVNLDIEHLKSYRRNWDNWLILIQSKLNIRRDNYRGIFGSLKECLLWYFSIFYLRSSVAVLRSCSDAIIWGLYVYRLQITRYSSF